MVLRAEQGGGWEVVQSAGRPEYGGVELAGSHDRAGQGLDMRVLPEPGSRFTAQIGITPKRAAMLVRLSPAIEAIMAGTAAADVAARFGYADQSHLTRDLRELAGYTPAARCMKLPFPK
jgi:hypothetical protein